MRGGCVVTCIWDTAFLPQSPLPLGSPSEVGTSDLVGLEPMDAAACIPIVPMGIGEEG